MIYGFVMFAWVEVGEFFFYYSKHYGFPYAFQSSTVMLFVLMACILATPYLVDKVLCAYFDCGDALEALKREILATGDRASQRQKLREAYASKHFLPRRSQGVALGVVFCYLLFEVFFARVLTGPDNVLVYYPDWFRSIDEWMRHFYLDHPRISRGALPRDKDGVVQNYLGIASVAEFMQSKVSSTMFVLTYFRLLLLPIYICFYYSLWNAVDWLMLDTAPDYINSGWSFIKKSLLSIVFFNFAAGSLGILLSVELHIEYWINGEFNGNLPAELMKLYAGILFASSAGIRFFGGWAIFWYRVFRRWLKGA